MRTGSFIRERSEGKGKCRDQYLTEFQSDLNHKQTIRHTHAKALMMIFVNGLFARFHLFKRRVILYLETRHILVVDFCPLLAHHIGGGIVANSGKLVTLTNMSELMKTG